MPKNKSTDTKFLRQELKKQMDLIDKSTAIYLESVTADPARRKYLREKVLPVIDKDIELIGSIVTEEAKKIINNMEHENEEKAENNTN